MLASEQIFSAKFEAIKNVHSTLISGGKGGVRGKIGHNLVHAKAVNNHDSQVIFMLFIFNGTVPDLSRPMNYSMIVGRESLRYPLRLPKIFWYFGNYRIRRVSFSSPLATILAPLRKWWQVKFKNSKIVLPGC